MSVDSERKLQNKVKSWLINDLGYTFLGNLEDQYNTPVKEKLLVASLKKRGYKKEQITRAVAELHSAVANQADTLYQVNKAVYSLLRYGKQGVKDDAGHRDTVHYIDWDDFDKNDFYVAEEVTVLRYDRMTTKRPDIVLYVNGIALGMFELKRSCVSVGEGIRQMLTNQKKENIESFFATEQLLFAGNEAEGLRYGTTETPEKYYLKWKEDTNATDALSAKIKAICEKETNSLRSAIVSL